MWLFERFRWYRKLRGGHWERWYLDFPVCEDVWFQTPHGGRPSLGARGTPKCEDYSS